MVTESRLLPLFTLVTVPLWLTVATFSLEDVQVTVPVQPEGATVARMV